MSQRIILADTQGIFRAGAARVLAKEKDFEVVVQCSDLPRLLEAIDSIRRSIAIFPSSISGDLEGLFDRVQHASSRSVVIVEHGETLDRTATSRADGVVLRSVAGPKLVECLRRVAAGERSVQRTEGKPVPSIDRVGSKVLNRLTPKELQIVALISDGKKNRDIALQLEAKEQVIKNHLRNIYDKVGVSDRLELAIFTLQHRALAHAAKQARLALRAIT